MGYMTPVAPSEAASRLCLTQRPRMWRAHVREPVFCELPDGEQLRLLTGAYTLQELTPTEYELMTKLGEAVRLRFTDVEQLRASRQLAIHGTWP